MGWVRTKREGKNVAFAALNDGSIIHNIQIVIDNAKFDEATIKSITTGSCIKVEGILVQSMGKGQTSEIQADKIEVIRRCRRRHISITKERTYPGIFKRDCSLKTYEQILLVQYLEYATMLLLQYISFLMTEILTGCIHQ